MTPNYIPLVLTLILVQANHLLQMSMKVASLIALHIHWTEYAGNSAAASYATSDPGSKKHITIKIVGNQDHRSFSWQHQKKFRTLQFANAASPTSIIV